MEDYIEDSLYKELSVDLNKTVSTKNNLMLGTTYMRQDMLPKKKYRNWICTWNNPGNDWKKTITRFYETN